MQHKRFAKNLRYYARLSRAFISRFKTTVLIAIIASISISITMGLILPNFSTKRTEIVGIVGRYHSQELPQDILRLVSDGLVEVSAEGEILPALAQSWELKDDDKTWVFKLKDSVKWHDGTEVTSDTLSYSFDDVEIERPDKKTIIFKLKNNFSPFPSVISRPVFKRGLLGTGQWRVKRVSLAGTFAEKITLQGPNKEKKIIRFYPTEERAKVGYQLGEIDLLSEINTPDPFTNYTGTNVKEVVHTDRYVAIFFNNESQVFGGTENKTTRQALAYALDKDNLGELRAISPIRPDSWAYNPEVKTYAYDKEKALETLGKTKDMTVRLMVTPTLLAKGELIAKQWAEVGVTTNITITSTIPSDFDAFLAMYDIPDDPDQYVTWHASQIGGTNISRYKNPRIDKLLEDGRLEKNIQERKKIYLDFQRFLLEDSPAIFLYHPKTFTVTRNKATL